MCHHAETTFPCRPESVAAARSWLVAELGRMYGHAEETTGDATVVVSELVTNCVRADAHDFTVGVEGHLNQLIIATTDAAPGTPRVRHPEPHDASGRGLMIVAALSRRWGVTPGPRAKTVWVEMAVPNSATPSFECRTPAQK